MSLLIEKDFGTPAVKSEKNVTLAIDGRPITVPEGTSVMRAAAEAGIAIPKLCASDNLDAFGSCRLCVCKIEGKRGMPASCTTPAEDGMAVTTKDEQITKIRKGVMELYLSDHPVDALAAPGAAESELFQMVDAVGVSSVRYGLAGDNHLDAEIDESNPYFVFDESKCILCSRCVRACDEVQGTMALTVEGRGFASKIAASMDEGFMDSECVSCGACVQACPTTSLQEKSVIEMGMPDETVLTTCAYCGVGCSFKAELKGGEVVRMVPWKDGKANHGHSCVKGRFAFGYATHQDRITKPMIRGKITDAWREVSWEEAFEFSASRLKETQEKYGRTSIGGITSSRCTNEEVWLVQRLIRQGFQNNNVDTCARVCHSPTGYGLKQTFGESAGTQNFDSIEETDCVLLIGSNPTDAHPVFGSQMKQRLRKGAKIIVADPRAIELVRTPHIEAAYHLPLKPGTNVALINGLAHVAAKEGLLDETFALERCDVESFHVWKAMILKDENSPENVSKITGVPAADIIGAAKLYAGSPNSGIYYGLGVTEHSQGSTMVMGMANLAMATGNIGRAGVGVNPMRGQNNVQGSCDMGSFPHELSGYRPVGDDAARGLFEAKWGAKLDNKPGYRIPNMFDEAINGKYKGMYIQGEDIAQSDPNTHHVEAAMKSMDILIVQDLFLNETARFAHVFLPGTSFLEKDGTFINAERRINRVRPVMAPVTGKHEWEVTQDLGKALGIDMGFNSSSEIMDEIADLTPTFTNVSFDVLDAAGSLQWPVNDAHPDGAEVMHVGEFVRGKGLFIKTEYQPTPEKTNRKFPLILTTGRILSQYNVGAQTRRTENNLWWDEDVLEIHPSDAETYAVRDGQWVSLSSRKGEITLRAKLSSRMQPGVVYTTFHHPDTGANVVTTENSDWATSCPEYKVTAVNVVPANHKSDWQTAYEEDLAGYRKIAEPAE